MFNYLLLLILIAFLGACGPDIPDEFFDSPPSPYGQYKGSTVNYLLKIGLCAELSECPKPGIKKWQSNIRIQLHGNYNDAEENELNNIISELSQLTGLSIKRVNSNANIDIYFVKQNDFKKYITQYNEQNPQDGLFAVLSKNDVLYKAFICIDYNIDDTRKLHLLREELTQSMGLRQDSDLYTDSIFQQNPQYTPIEYSNIDKEVIQLLYNNKLRPGMTEEEVTSALTPPVQTASKE